MEVSEPMKIDGEDYQVVDECIDEDTAVKFVTQDTLPHSSSNSRETLLNSCNNEHPTVNLTIASCSALSLENTMQESNQTTQKDTQINVIQRQEKIYNSRDENMDFTADISLDQLGEQRDLTDEDVMMHLDEIENIVLDMNTFPMRKDDQQDKEENSTCEVEIKKENIEESLSTKPIIADLSVNDVIANIKKEECKHQDNSWYKDKLKEKEATVKERLSKLARVLRFSYPTYEKWLETVEKLHGTPVCQLKPARPCSLDKPYTNRWKFICTRKIVPSLVKTPASGSTKNMETVWQLEPTGTWGANANDESELPPFVSRAVKVFKDFLQTTEELEESGGTKDNFFEDISMEMDSKKEIPPEGKQHWMWLVVRCNSMDELMLFATGKNISRSTMDRLKHVYESGLGKECNVKSLYCKCLNKREDTTITNTTFLVGSEALDEVVGGLKIQLAPKTNFWSNAAGAENVGNEVLELLAPTPTTTVLDIGCGIGLIGLMMASKCQQVIGVDSPSEIEEAEMICDLNNIKNATFIMGSPSEVPDKIEAALKGRKAFAVINANTNFGRSIDIMTCLRKVPSLKRIAMITTLTKQSVRAILELTRPAEQDYGKPFQPKRACVVDTLPSGPHFEVVIVMERRVIAKPMQPPQLAKSLRNIDAKVKSNKDPPNDGKAEITEISKSINVQITNKSPEKPLGISPVRKLKVTAIKNPIFPRIPDNGAVQNKVHCKRSHTDNAELPPKKLKKFDKFNNKTFRADVPGKKKKEWNVENPQLRLNPLYEKKFRDSKEQADLRERLSNNRIDSEIAQKVKEHQAMLEIAKEKLSGPAPTVDIATAKQLQNMLNMVLEQTNKLQSQLPRSVWDRIAPPESPLSSSKMQIEEEDTLAKSRYVQETIGQDIVITTSNKNFVNHNIDQKPPIRKNILPLEPDMMPVGPAIPRQQDSRRRSPPRYRDFGFHKELHEVPWNQGEETDNERWATGGPMRQPASPPIKCHISPSRRFSPKRPLLSPPRRPHSPPRRHFSPDERPRSPLFHRRENLDVRSGSPTVTRQQISSPLRRPISPFRLRPLSASMRMNSPPGQLASPNMRRGMRAMSPSSIPLFRSDNHSPTRDDDPLRVQFGASRRQGPSPDASMYTPRPSREMGGPRRQFQEEQRISPVNRVVSPQRSLMPLGRTFSSSPIPKKFGDEWDIPSRGAVEQSSWLGLLERTPNRLGWRSDRSSISGPTTSNFEPSSTNTDRFRKNMSQDKWSGDGESRESEWIRGSNDWNSNPRQLPAKGNWRQQNSRWSGPLTGDNDSWNLRGKEDFDSRKELGMSESKMGGQGRWESLHANQSWKQREKDDWNDLPEDARDPWGEESDLGLKDRGINNDRPSNSFAWMRETDNFDSVRRNEQGDSFWIKSKDAWQNEGYTLSSKPQWQNNGSQKPSQSRWFSQNVEMGRKGPSSTWQSESNSSSWQPQSSSFQPYRFFSNNLLK